MLTFSETTSDFVLQRERFPALNNNPIPNAGGVIVALGYVYICTKYNLSMLSV